jgi:hypothetical protein
LNRSPLLWGGGLYRSIVVDVIDPVCFLLSVPTQPTPLFHFLSCVSLLFLLFFFIRHTLDTRRPFFFYFVDSICSIQHQPSTI